MGTSTGIMEWRFRIVEWHNDYRSIIGSLCYRCFSSAFNPKSLVQDSKIVTCGNWNRHGFHFYRSPPFGDQCHDIIIQKSSKNIVSVIKWLSFICVRGGREVGHIFCARDYVLRPSGNNYVFYIPNLSFPCQHGLGPK